MGKINRLCFAFYLIMICTFMSACCNCDDAYTPPIPPYSNSGLDLVVFDNSNEFPVLLSTDSNYIDTINKNAFGIRMYLRPYLLATYHSRFKPPFFITSAHAFCDCDDYYPSYRNFESVKEFQIKTLNDFDNAMPEGADITSYFRILNRKDFAIVNQDSVVFDFPTDFVLMETPEVGRLHQFEFSFYISDTTQIIDTTKLVYLK